MAKTVNLGAPYAHRITLRLTDDQFEFLGKISEILGVSPSDYLRMSINTAMVSFRKFDDKVEQAYQSMIVDRKEEVGMSDENVKTYSNNLV